VTGPVVQVSHAGVAGFMVTVHDGDRLRLAFEASGAELRQLVRGVEALVPEPEGLFDARAAYVAECEAFDAEGELHDQGTGV
jgi:hypothetical protein